MKQHLFRAALLVVAGTLMGCGGSTDDPSLAIQPEPEEPFAYLSEGGYRVPFVTEGAVPTERIVDQTRRGASQYFWTVQENNTLDIPGFRVFGGASGTPLLLEAESQTGATAHQAYVVGVTISAAQGTLHNTPELGYRLTRAEGSLPLTGQASYSGKYAATFDRAEPSALPGLAEHYIQGDVALNADFAKGTISGVISNRSRHSIATGAVQGNPLDVNLGEIEFGKGNTDFDDGFITGGAILPGNPAYTPVPGGPFGTWSVGFSGPSAKEAVGSVFIVHDLLNTPGFVPADYRERGVFIAAKQ